MLLIILPHSSLCAQDYDPAEIEFPDFLLADFTGNTIQKIDLEGKVVVIDFWATWCAPCIKSFPAMFQTEKNFSENDKVIFLYINTLELTGRDEVYIKDFLNRKGIDIQVYFDKPLSGGKTLTEQLNITTLPQKVILDLSGNIRYRDKGFRGSDEELIRDLTSKINSLLTN